MKTKNKKYSQKNILEFNQKDEDTSLDDEIYSCDECGYEVKNRFTSRCPNCLGKEFGYDRLEPRRKFTWQAQDEN